MAGPEHSGTYRAIKIVPEQAFGNHRFFEREFNGVLKFEPVSRLHDGLMNILQAGRNDAAGLFLLCDGAVR